MVSPANLHRMAHLDDIQVLTQGGRCGLAPAWSHADKF